MNNPSGSTFIEVKRQQDTTCLVLEGDWTLDNVVHIEHAVDEVTQQLGDEPYGVDSGDIAKLDTSGALLLKKLLAKKTSKPHISDAQRELLDFLPSFSEYKPRKKRDQTAFVAFFTDIGKKTLLARDFFWEIFVFIGRVAICFLKNFLHPSRFRIPSIVRHIQDTGLRALPIVGLLAILISMVISYQAAVQLKKFGADIYTIDLAVVSLLREMGVLITSIMVAGRSGSAYAAEIGVMKLREEVSALKTMGLDPIEVLVLPRIIALVITLPLLTFLADLIGLIGGGLMSLTLLDISLYQYFNRAQEVATMQMFFVGMIKAPVFALIIAIISCYQGLNVSGSAESIGRRTTLSVVQAIFLVIMADALFSVVFSKVGI